MSQPDKREWIDSTKRIVVKIGSGVLVDENAHLDETHITHLVEQMAALQSDGRQVICVSSGAVAAGVTHLEATQRPGDLPSLQAAAAIGQADLMTLYSRLFEQHKIAVAQVLLTHDDLRSRERHLNARNTLSRLLAAGVIPIANENDTVAVDEIRFGDNDHLSALLCTLIRADLLVMLTGEEGLLTKPPEEAGELVSHVASVTEHTHEMAGANVSTRGKGGMRSKVQAAEVVTRAGERCIIANGRTKNVLTRLFAGDPLGTLFEPRPNRMAGRKRWIAFFDHPRGDLHIDTGAAAALQSGGRSLLAIGVIRVDGHFSRGEPVRILDETGQIIGRGLVNFTAPDLRQIMGRQSDEIVTLLGRCDYEEVVHRDNLVLG